MATEEAICFVCGTALDGTVRVVLVRGRNHEEHCSEECLLETVRLRRAQRAARQTRLLLRVLVVLLVAGAGRFTWSRYRCPPPVAISFSASDLVTLATKEEIPLPPRIGPSWPPTDDDWKFVHRHTLIGARILHAAPDLANVADTALRVASCRPRPKFV